MAGYLSMKMKRKDLEEVNDDFSDFSLSSPARKIRRLDAELPPIMEEDEPEMPVGFEESSRVGDTLIDDLPCDLVNEERAIVLFKPMNTGLVHSPSSFSVSSDLIAGFKNELWSSQGSRLKSREDEDDATQNKKCLAVIPWVPSQVLGQEVSQTEKVPVVMEAEDVGEAMEIEDNNLSMEQGQANGFGGMTGSEGLHQWHQQHCLTPQLPQNTSTPIVWYR